MRSVQTALMVVGATVLGSVWGCVAIGMVGAFTVFRARSGEDWGTAFGVMYSGLCCGIPLGAILGIVAGARMLRDEQEDWSPIIWIGVALGAALGLFISYREVVGQVQSDWLKVLLTVVVAATIGTMGGMLAAIGEGIWRRTSEGHSQVVRLGLRLLLALIPAVLLLGLATRLFSRQWTGYQVGLCILVGVPILCGVAAWFRVDENQPVFRRSKTLGSRSRR
jgi:hypothetical protein